MSFEIPRFTMPHIPSQTEMFFDSLKKHVQRMTAELEEKESLVLLYYLKSSEAIQVEDIHYSAPFLMTVSGLNSSGNKCKVVVHLNCFELVMKIVKTVEPVERKRIGFSYEAETTADAG